MSVINVRCVDQSLTVENSPIITTGDSRCDSISFDFCESWRGWTKTAVFYRNEYNPYHVILDEKDVAEIPREVLKTEGSFFFGVFGVKDGAVRTTEALRYKVKKGVITSEASVPDPTPDIYAQILSKYGELVSESKVFTPLTDVELDEIFNGTYTEA